MSEKISTEMIEEAELAAAVACVLAFIEEEAGREALVEGASGWGAAARLEGAGLARLTAPPPQSWLVNPWLHKHLLSVLFCLAMTAIALCVPCQATAVPESEPVAPACPSAGLAETGAHATLIRAALALGVERAGLGFPDGAEIRDLASGDLAYECAPDSHCEVRIDRAHVLVLDKLGEATDTGKGLIAVPRGEDGLVAVGGKVYRGALLLVPAGKSDRVNVINIVDLEDYLLSVVPAEMPSTWPLEALKAQAVAARSYAVANLGKHEKDGYDVKTNTDDQVYPGVASETEATNLAVAQTTGVVIKHQGRVASALFHSTSGGSTESGEHVWGKAVPYLEGVRDFDERSPYATWSRSVDIAQMESVLGKDGKSAGQLLNILVLSRSPSMRVKDVLIAGSQTCRIVSGETIRRVLSLPSTNFNVDAGPDGYLFAGRGFGHGLGLSQWGAMRLAEHGYNAAQILAYYYKDVSLDRL